MKIEYFGKVFCQCLSELEASMLLANKYIFPPPFFVPEDHQGMARRFRFCGVQQQQHRPILGQTLRLRTRRRLPEAAGHPEIRGQPPQQPRGIPLRPHKPWTLGHPEIPWVSLRLQAPQGRGRGSQSSFGEGGGQLG